MTAMLHLYQATATEGVDMAQTGWPTEANPGIAVIAPTGFGTFGIWWSDFPAMERRGGYSGPYATPQEAEDSARSWGEHWECPVTIERREVKP